MKVAGETDTNVSGFDVLNNKVYVEFLKDNVVVIPNESFLAKICGDEGIRIDIRIDISNYYCNNDRERSQFLNMSPRTLYRLQNKAEA